MVEQTEKTEGLEKRVARLEHQNRVMIWGVTFVSVILTSATIMSCQSSQFKQQKENSTVITKTIQAERFVLIGSDGKLHAELSSKETPLRGDGACLTIHDAEGNERLAIGVGSKGPFAGPFIEMYGTNGQSK
jgi:hypothetical protein